MLKERFAALSLTAWDVALLLGIGLAPIHGGAAATIIALTSLVAMVFMVQKRPSMVSPANLALTAIFFLYFFYFLIHGAFIGGDFDAAFDSMKGNVPIVFVAILCLYMGHGRNKLTAFEVGRWAAMATIVTFSFAIFLYALKTNGMLSNESRLLDPWDKKGHLQLFSRNSLMFGSMYTTLSFLSLLAYAKKTPLQKIMAISAGLIGLSVVALWTQSRGASLAALPLMGLAVWYVRPKLQKFFIALACLAIIVPAVYLFNDAAALKINAVSERLYVGITTAQGAAPTPESSTSQRIIMYDLGLQAIKDAPFAGYGFQNRFNAILPYFQSAPPFRHGHLHNTFISHTVAGGVIGCLVLLLFILTPVMVEALIKPQSRDIRYLTWLIVMVMTGIGMTTEVLGHFIHASFFSALILIHLMATLNEKNSVTLSGRGRTQGVRAAL